MRFKQKPGKELTFVGWFFWILSATRRTHDEVES